MCIWKSPNPEIADIVNGEIVIYKSGETTLKAYQDESARFSAGESEVAHRRESAAERRCRQRRASSRRTQSRICRDVQWICTGDDASCIDTPLARCSATASQSSPAGNYEITVSGGEDDCYTFTDYTSGTLVVTAVSGVNAPTLDGVSIYLADKRVMVKGISADVVEIFALNGRLAGRYRAGDIVDLYRPDSTLPRPPTSKPACKSRNNPSRHTRQQERPPVDRRPLLYYTQPVNEFTERGHGRGISRRAMTHTKKCRAGDRRCEHPAAREETGHETTVLSLEKPAPPKSRRPYREGTGEEEQEKRPYRRLLATSWGRAFFQGAIP